MKRPASTADHAHSHEDGVPPHRHGGRDAPPLDEEALDRAAALFRVLGDPGRLRLLQRLSDGERCVSELVDAEQTDLSLTSQRLRVLRSERLVIRRRAGKHVYYALADDHVAELVRTTLAHVNEGLPPSTPATSKRTKLDHRRTP